MAAPSCSLDTSGDDWAIYDAIFDCNNLGICPDTCPKPRRNLLKAAAEYCGCTFEWYFHAKWMGTALAALLYVFMNAARVFLFSGLTRVLWKYLYPDRFTVLASCDSGGSLITSSSGRRGSRHENILRAIQTRTSKRNDDDTSITLSRKVDSCLRQFYARGLALVLASLLANAAWIYIVSVAAQPLRPSIWR